MKALKGIVITLLVVLAALLIFSSVTYVVNQGEYAVVKQFGKVVQIESEPGLKFKVPGFQCYIRY